MLKSEFNKTKLGQIYETLSETFGEMEGETSLPFSKLRELEKKKYLADCEISGSLWENKKKLNDVSSRLAKNKDSEEFKTTIDKLNDKLKLINTTEPVLKKDIMQIVEFIDNHGKKQTNIFQNELGGYHAKILEKRFGEIKSLAEEFLEAEDTVLITRGNISKISSDLKKGIEKVQDTKLRNFFMNYPEMTYNQGVLNRVGIIKSKLDSQRVTKLSNRDRSKSPEKRENAQNQLDKCREFLYIAKRVIKFYNWKMDTCEREVLGENGDCKEPLKIETLSGTGEKPFITGQENSRDFSERLSLEELLESVKREEPSSRQADGLTRKLTERQIPMKKHEQPEKC